MSIFKRSNAGDGKSRGGIHDGSTAYESQLQSKVFRDGFVSATQSQQQARQVLNPYDLSSLSKLSGDGGGSVLKAPILSNNNSIMNNHRSRGLYSEGKQYDEPYGSILASPSQLGGNHSKSFNKPTGFRKAWKKAVEKYSPKKSTRLNEVT